MPDHVDLTRAIVIDFESFQDGPPLLCGTLIDGDFQQTVFDERLQPAAQTKYIPVLPACDYLRQLVKRASSEDRHFIAFSTKERNDINQIVDCDISERYVNALKIAKRWRKQVAPAEHQRVARKRRRMRERRRYVGGYGNRFIDFAKLAGIPIPSDYGLGCEAKRIRDTINQLERRREYTNLTPCVKGKWTKALKHNRFDVEGLSKLCALMLKDIASD